MVESAERSAALHVDHPAYSSSVPPRIIALTGFMGAGKSTVARAFASLRGWEFLDLDEEIERKQGQKIRDLFRSLGEVRFREVEGAALRNALATITRDTVIALGGGTFIQPANAAALEQQGASVVFLEVPVEELFRRCRDCISPEENLRPLAADPEAFFALYERRLEHYRRADLTVHAADKSVDAIVDEIIVLLASRSGC